MKRHLALFVLIVSVVAACGGGGSNESSNQDFNGADVMFAQMMIPHHEQAIELSDIALDPTVGAATAVATLATAIKAAQDPEISQMKGLLSTWEKPLTPEDGMDHGSMMKGMLSPDEMNSLAALRAMQFDAAWAKAMIAHHEGAISMAEDVIKTGKNAEVRALAETIVASQEAEIAELQVIAGS